MSHLFCHSCGNKLAYTHAPPNFCAKCGQSLNSTASANTAQGLPSLEESVVISQDETDAKSVPHLSQLEIEYEDINNKPITLGSLVGEHTPTDYEGPQQSRPINEVIDEKKQG